LALCFAEKSFEMTPTQKQIRDALRRAKEMDAANCNMCGGLDAESLKTVISVLSASLWNTDMSQAPKDGTYIFAKDDEGQQRVILWMTADGSLDWYIAGKDGYAAIDCAYPECTIFVYFTPTAWKPLLGDGE
jgi:hypothetical protein